MTRAIVLAILFLAASMAANRANAAKVSVLIDLDPASAAQTVIVESLATDPKGMLYACDRVSGNVWRIDPRNPKLIVVGKVQEREIDGKKVLANVSGIVFNQAGDLYLTAGGFNEVLRIRGRNLDPKEPGVAQTFATETEGANGIAFDKNNNLYVSGGRNGRIYRTGAEGGRAEIFSQIALHTRKLPDGKTEQAADRQWHRFRQARHDALHHRHGTRRDLETGHRQRQSRSTRFNEPKRSPRRRRRPGVRSPG